jgi:hypothetical protein
MNITSKKPHLSFTVRIPRKSHPDLSRRKEIIPTVTYTWSSAHNFQGGRLILYYPT